MWSPRSMKFRRVDASWSRRGGAAFGSSILPGRFFRHKNTPPTRGATLAEGIHTCLVESKEPGQYRASRRGEMVKCPWHGWEFDIRTGQSWCDPAKLRIRQYPVSVRGGNE